MSFPNLTYKHTLPSTCFCLLIIVLSYHELQILDLKKKQENQFQILKKKQRSDEAVKWLQDEIQSIKTQKVGC